MARAKRKLTEVAKNGQHPEWHRLSAEEQPYDEVFFRKIDVKVGRELVNAGRMYPETRWVIIRIQSDRGYGKGYKSVQQVERLADIVTLRRKDIVDIRHCTFGALSYSAIWRLP